MKKIIMLLAAVAFSSAAFAQTTVTHANPATGAKTTTTVRENGTVKTESRTGRTKAGEAVHDTKEGTEEVADKTGHAIKRGAQKTGHALRKGGHAVKKEVKKL